MSFLIYAIDHVGMDFKRENIRTEHRLHLQKMGHKLLASGALLSEDKRTVIGGISLLDTDDYDEAVTFAHDDPYTRAGIRKDIQIMRWRKRWWDGAFLGE